VRRVLGLAADLPGLRRVDLEVNYRCPAAVLDRAVRLVEHNHERFAKAVRPGPGAAGRLVLAPVRADDEGLLRRLLAAWPEDDGRRAVLARTRRELLPLAVEALALGIPFRGDGILLPLEDPRIDELLVDAQADARRLPVAARIAARGRDGGDRSTEERARDGTAGSPAAFGPVVGSAAGGTAVGPAGDARTRPAGCGPEPRRAGGEPLLGDGAAPPPDDPDPEPAWALEQLRAALVGWAVRLPPGVGLAAAIADARARLAELRTPDARLTLATAHATKGLEWDDVAVLGMTEGRFPSARSLAEAGDPARAMEEERRLAYVAWTRARRSLVLVHDPEAPSQFLREAFDPAELEAAERPP
jgi:hypothetical protein